MRPTPVSSAPPATGAHHAAPAATTCLNCQQPLQGAFCHQCGQAASTPTHITLHHLLHEVPHVIWHVDHGIFYNLRELLTRPGLSMQRYLSGERKKFFNPLSMLLLVGGVSAFLFTKFHIIPFDTHQPGITPRIARMQQEVMTIISRYQAWLSIFFLPIEASVATLLLRRTTGYSWAEQLVAAALMSGAIAALNLLFVPALAYWSGTAPVGNVSALMALVLILYKGWGYAQLQKVQQNTSPLKRWMLGLATSAGQYFGIILLTGVVMLLMLLAMPHAVRPH